MAKVSMLFHCNDDYFLLDQKNSIYSGNNRRQHSPADPEPWIYSIANHHLNIVIVSTAT